MRLKYFWIIFDRNYDKGFGIGIQPIWIHRHMKEQPYHLHILLNLFFWFLEIHIGKEDRD